MPFEQMFLAAVQELTGQSVEKLLEKYGEQALAALLNAGQEIAQDHAPEIIDLAVDRAGDLVEVVSPAVTGTLGKAGELTGLTMSSIIGQGSGEALGSLLENAAEGLPDIDLSPLGAKLRDSAGKGAGRLGDLTDAQLGTLAVLISQSSDRGGNLAARLRKRLRRS